jgi:Zn-dependent protease
MTCGNDLVPGALACPQCHALVHSEQLAILSARAQASEAAEDFASARETWQKSLALLPYESTQAEWVRTHLYRLQLAQQVAPVPEDKHKWAKKLGPLAPIAIVLAKAKWLFTLLKFKFLFSFAAFFAFYFTLWGWKFGAGIAALILIHEMGHYIDIRRRGLPAEMPVFLPGFGAYVKWKALGVSARTRAAVSLAGPLAGGLASLACLMLWWKTGQTIWAGLGRFGAMLNLLNLLPLWVLDGAGATAALGKSERWALLAVSVLLAPVMGEWTFLLVAGAIGYRLTTKDFPPVASRGTLIYFVSVLVLLGGVLRFLPGSGFEMK